MWSPSSTLCARRCRRGESTTCDAHLEVRKSPRSLEIFRVHDPRSTTNHGEAVRRRSATHGISLAILAHEVTPMPRDTFPRVFRSILCPVDFSPNSRAALRYAAMLARLSEAHLIVLYVDDPLLAAVMAARATAPTMIAANEKELQRLAARGVRGGSAGT